jgi:prolyl oligopeptidase
MKKIIYFICIVMVACNNGKQKMTYPETRKDNIVDNYFGVEVADPYRWLENDTSQEVKKWVEAQNKLTFEYLSKIPYRENIKKRLADLINYEKRSVPFKKGKNYFYFKNAGLQNQSVLYITDDINKPGKVLIDPNTLSKDGTIALGTIKISPDGNILAYAISTAGSDWNTICFLDINSGKPLNDTLQWVKFSGIAWFNDGVYYSGYDEPKKGKEFSQANQYHKLFYHKLGTQQKNDVVVLENPNDPLMNFFASSTSDDAILCIYEEKAGKLGNALRIIDFRETKPILN